MQVPNGAAGLYLLGRICRLTNRQAKAAEYYAKALRLDPLLWTAYEELCALGMASPVLTMPRDPCLSQIGLHWAAAGLGANAHLLYATLCLCHRRCMPAAFCLSNLPLCHQPPKTTCKADVMQPYSLLAWQQPQQQMVVCCVAVGFDDLAADVCDPSPPIMEQPATGSGIMSPGVAGTFSAMSIDGHPQPAAATAATAAPGAAPMSCSQPTADRYMNILALPVLDKLYLKPMPLAPPPML